jgi:hypothetical protein
VYRGRGLFQGEAGTHEAHGPRRIRLTANISPEIVKRDPIGTIEALLELAP